MKVIY